jgi:hypothetical protein
MVPTMARPLAGKSTPAFGRTILVGVGSIAIDLGVFVGRGVEVGRGVVVLVGVLVLVGVEVLVGVSVGG